MRETADRIAANSAFVPEHLPFHCPLLGSLHMYSREVVKAALTRSSMELRGRFLKWEVYDRAYLRATIELEGVDTLISKLQQDLPQGRPWRKHFVTVGCVQGIEAARHAEFLAAVSAAFPIDSTLVFTTASLEYHDLPRACKKVAATALTRRKLVPRAVTSIRSLKTDSRSSSTKKANKMRPRAASQHMKRERQQKRAGASVIDKLIRTGGTSAPCTGTTSRATSDVTLQTMLRDVARLKLNKRGAQRCEDGRPTDE